MNESAMPVELARRVIERLDLPDWSLRRQTLERQARTYGQLWLKYRKGRVIWSDLRPSERTAMLTLDHYLGPELDPRPAPAERKPARPPMRRR